MLLKEAMAIISFSWACGSAWLDKLIWLALYQLNYYSS